MRAAILAGCILALSAHAALAKDWKLALLPGPDQEVTFEDGRPFVRSDKPPKSGVALVVATERFGEKQSPTLVLLVKNYSDQPVNFTLANVAVSVDAEPQISVLTVDDIEARARAVEKKAKQAAMWQAIAVGLQAGAAGMSQTSTYRSNTYTPYGSASTYGTITTPGNAFASSAIVANGQNQIQATREYGRRAAAESWRRLTIAAFGPRPSHPMTACRRH